VTYVPAMPTVFECKICARAFARGERAMLMAVAPSRVWGVPSIESTVSSSMVIRPIGDTQICQSC
jgi:hypothetical protein